MRVSSHKTIISNNGAVVSSGNGKKLSSYDRWRMSWNGNLFAPPESGAVLYYPGHPETGSTITDFSGQGNNGTIVGAIWRREPSGLPVLYFDGDDYINITTALTASLSALTVGTIILWVRPDDATPADNSGFVGFGDTDANVRLLLFMTVDSKFRSLVTLALGGWDVTVNVANFSDATWCCVGVTHNGTAPILYVDGVAPAQTFGAELDKTDWFSALAGLDNGRAGCWNYNSGGNSSFFTGRIALPRIYNRALSATEVVNIFNRERHLFSV